MRIRCSINIRVLQAAVVKRKGPSETGCRIIRRIIDWLHFIHMITGQMCTYSVEGIGGAQGRGFQHTVGHTLG